MCFWIVAGLFSSTCAFSWFMENPHTDFEVTWSSAPLVVLAVVGWLVGLRLLLIEFPGCVSGFKLLDFGFEIAVAIAWGFARAFSN